MSFEPRANSLVLHDWSGELNQGQWLDLAVGFISELGATPNVCACGKSDNRASLMQPKTARMRLLQGTQYAFMSIYSAADKRDPELKWDAVAGFNIAVTPMKTLSFHYDSHGNPFDSRSFTSLVGRLVEFVEPAYGYGFQREYSKGPNYYAYDIAFGLDDRLREDRDEKTRMLLWHTERLDMTTQNRPAPYRHLGGLFRDVFPLNFISGKHLAQVVEGISLEEWICANESRGDIQRISTNLWSWTIPESNLLCVRNCLQLAALLVERPQVAH